MDAETSPSRFELLRALSRRGRLPVQFGFDLNAAFHDGLGKYTRIISLDDVFLYVELLVKLL